MLGTYLDAEGRAYPKTATLAANLGIAPATVRTHLRSLETGGYLITTRGVRHGSAVTRIGYQVTVPLESLLPSLD